MSNTPIVRAAATRLLCPSLGAASVRARRRPVTDAARCLTCGSNERGLANRPWYNHDTGPFCNASWHHEKPQPSDATRSPIDELANVAIDAQAMAIFPPFMEVNLPTEPLGCPFCLSAELNVGEKYPSRLTRVSCENCGASGPTFSDRVEAIVWWNDTRDSARRRLLLADDEAPLPDSGGWPEMKSRSGERYDCPIHGAGEGRDCPTC